MNNSDVISAGSGQPKVPVLGSIVKKEDIVIAQIGRAIQDPNNPEEKIYQSFKILAYRDRNADLECRAVFNVPAPNGGGKNAYTFTMPISNPYTFTLPISNEILESTCGFMYSDDRGDEIAFLKNLNQCESVVNGRCLPISNRYCGIIYGAANPNSYQNGQFLETLKKIDSMYPETDGRDYGTGIAFPGHTYTLDPWEPVFGDVDHVDVTQEELQVIDKFLDPKFAYMSKSELGILQGAYDREFSSLNFGLNCDGEEMNGDCAESADFA